MRTLRRDFFGWLASVVLAAYLKLEDWDSYEVDTLKLKRDLQGLRKVQP